MLRGMLCLLVLVAGAALAQPAPADPGETRRLHELFDADWQWRMRTFPEWATFRGDHRYGDRLNDRSRQAENQAYAYARDRLARLRSIEPASLSSADRISYDILLANTLQWIEGEAHAGLRTQVVDAQEGLHLGFSELLRVSPAAREADARNVLARMAAFPRAVDQVIERLREGIAMGWVTFRPSMQRVLAQIDGQLNEDVTQSVLYEPFTRLGADLPEILRNQLSAEGQRALREQVYPAMSRLRSFIATEYLPRAPADGALGSYPGGAAAYDYLIRLRTTTDLPANAIHAIGQREVARLRAEMEAQMKLSGFEGDFAQFVKFLNSDPRFFHASAEALLAGYRDIAGRVDPELPKLFAELPRAQYGIRAIPAHLGAGRAEYYDSPAPDGTRPGWFNANTAALARRPIWGMETLFAHEAVPGHHLQIARAQELTNLPQFRRVTYYTAFIEGWALYAETLGDQLGLYKEPYSRFGHLQWQIFRAARLAVDTGIHAFGWTRAQAIDWMTERTDFARETVEAEVDRYYVWPGQALGYMIGELKIIELRDRARAALGERFDLRRFHMAVLDNGAVPLPVLERCVDDWIAAERARSLN
ncbi:MAG: DUF885 domain-containing protein [Betaproteobacteria bacterium]|nr:DUF885 domain-containing protein [Betaproteobacteria bacterium]